MGDENFLLLSSQAKLTLRILPVKPITVNDNVHVTVSGEEELAVRIYGLIKEYLKEKSNYNGWQDEKDYQISHQLRYEAERELLKSEPPTEGTLTFYTVGGETVAGLEEGYVARLKLYTETCPALSITRGGLFVAMVFLKDLDQILGKEPEQ